MNQNATNEVDMLPPVVPPPVISQAIVAPPALLAPGPSTRQPVVRRKSDLGLDWLVSVIASSLVVALFLVGGWWLRSHRDESRQASSSQTNDADRTAERIAESPKTTVANKTTTIRATPTQSTEKVADESSPKQPTTHAQLKSTTEAIADVSWNTFTAIDNSYSVSAPGIAEFDHKSESSPGGLVWVETVAWQIQDGVVGIIQTTFSDDALVKSAETRVREAEDRVTKTSALGSTIELQSTRRVLVSGFSGLEWIQVMRQAGKGPMYYKSLLVATPRRCYLLIANTATTEILAELSRRFMDTFKLSRTELMSEEQRHLAFRRSLETTDDFSNGFAPVSNEGPSTGGGFCRSCSGTGNCASCYGTRKSGTCSYCNGFGNKPTSTVGPNTSCGQCGGSGKGGCWPCGGSGRCRSCGGLQTVAGGTYGGVNEAERQAAARRQTDSLINQMESMGISGDVMRRALFGN